MSRMLAGPWSFDIHDFDAERDDLTAQIAMALNPDLEWPGDGACSRKCAPMDRRPSLFNWAAIVLLLADAGVASEDPHRHP